MWLLAYPRKTKTPTIHHTENLPSGDGIWVYFEYDNLDEHVKNLIQKGIEFEQLPTDQT
jgi:hypothetical protein